MPAAHLQNLMAVSRVPRNAKTGPEERCTMALANELRALTLTGDLDCCWWHTPNEHAARRSPGALMTQSVRKAMGVIPGVYDFVFVWRNGAACLEIKVGRNRATPGQRDFALWLHDNGVYQYVLHFRSGEPRDIADGVQRGLVYLRCIGVLAADIGNAP